jgi:2-oxo-4-hydroxy-4-carboxy--5-ureidoimidazoline (OHCU) decarboxylase
MIEQGLHKKQDEEMEAVMQELKVLNDKYEEKFGFKFVVFVAGRARKEIIPVMNERLLNSRDAELQTGLDAMIDIARDRLEKMQYSSAL